MTFASDLAHLVCSTMPVVPGVVHDPALPLILGDQASGNYAVQTYNVISKRWTLQVLSSTAGSATIEFGVDGKIYVNGAEFTGGGGGVTPPELAAAIAACEAAQAAAETAANDASVSADGAADAVGEASGQAALAALFAVGPEGSTLPGGGNSAAVSAALAEQIAILSRQLDLGAVDISASHVFQSGFLYTEQQVIVTTPIVVTIPPNIYSSLERKAAWATYKLAALSGSIQVIPQGGGGTNLITPNIVARSRSFVRILGTQAGRNTLSFVTSVPAVVAGDRLLLIFGAQHFGTNIAVNVNLTNDKGLTFATLRPLPANPTNAARPDYAVYEHTFTASGPAQDIAINFDEGPNVHFQSVDRFLIRNAEAGAPRIQVDGSASARSSFTTTLVGLGSQSLVIALAAIAAGDASGTLSNFSSNLSLIVKGGSAGAANAAASNTDEYRNQQFGLASGVATASGNFVSTANFSTAAFKGELIVVAYAPLGSIGAGVVTLKLEDGRDTLTVPYGVMELWFQPDGTEVHVRTPKP